MRDARWRAAIVGLGAVGAAYDGPESTDTCLTHAKAYVDDPRSEIVGGCDPDPNKRTAFSSKWRAPSYETLSELLDNQAPEVLSVCTPTATHVEVLSQIAASRNRPRLVVCEKPLAESSMDARRAVARLRDAGIEILVDHPRRFDPAHRAVRSAIGAGTLGRIQAVRALYGKGIRHNGVHIVDLLLFFLGWPASVEALARDASEDPTIDVYVRYPKSAAILSGYDAKHFEAGEFDLLGTEGRFRFDYPNGTFSAWRPTENELFAGYRKLAPVEPPCPFDLRRLMRPVIGNAIDFLEGRDGIQCSGEDAITGLILVEGAIRSARHGGVVELATADPS